MYSLMNINHLKQMIKIEIDRSNDSIELLREKRTITVEMMEMKILRTELLPVKSSENRFQIVQMQLIVRLSV